MPALDLNLVLDQTLSQLTALAPPPSSIPCAEHLATLFSTLKEADSSSERAQAEDLIWALWCTHEDKEGREMMHKTMGAIARDAHDEAHSTVEEMVRRWPSWAEVWNKRATLYFLQGRDMESVIDIQRTLALEPRHFGAISGFAQICLRAGEEHSALLAFEVVLRINPNLTNIEEAVARLRHRANRTVH